MKSHKLAAALIGLLVAFSSYAGDQEIVKRLEKQQAKQLAYTNEFNLAKSLESIAAFEKRYKGDDPDNLIPRLEPLKLQLEMKKEKTDKQAAIDNDRNRIQYIKDLRGKYAKQIVAESPEALRIISSYNIDCQSPDHRVLPLLNVLYLQAALNNAQDWELKFHLQNRGKFVRIYTHYFQNGVQSPIRAPTLSWEINEWGELRPFGMPFDTVFDVCYGHGPYGQVWLMPGERM